MTFASAVLATSPYLYWRCGEASGTTAADSTGNGHTGDFVSATLGQTGLVPGDPTATSVLIDNANDNVWEHAALSFSSIGFTAMMVLKSTASSGGIFAQGTQNLLSLGSPNLSAVIDSTGHALSYATASLFDGNAHLVIFMVKATTIELWVDGVQVATASHSKTGTTRTGFQLKRGSAGPSSGTYQDMALWTGALTSGQIASIYSAYLGAEVHTVTGTVDLGLALEGNAVSAKPVTGTVDLALALEGNAVSAKPVTGTVDLALALEGNAVSVKPVTGTIDLNLTLEGSASSVEVHEVTGTIDLGLTLEGNAESVIPATGYAAYMGDVPVTLYMGDQPAYFG